MGFEYELLKIFADEIGVELEVKVVKNLDSPYFDAKQRVTVT